MTIRDLQQAADACTTTGQWADAESILRELLAAGDRRPAVYHVLGQCLSSLARGGEAIRVLRQALAMDPANTAARTLLIYLLDMQPEATPAQCHAERRRFWQQYGAERCTQAKPHDNDRDPERPLRVGYVSGDFRFHSAALIFAPIVVRHAAAVRPYCYSTLAPALYDPTTEHFQIHTEWRDVADLSEAALADRIREDGIDILVDLSGYTDGHRLLAFCRKPAPIQVTAWGYATGLGLDAIDVLFSDPVALPLAARAHITERVVDLPCLVGYEPPPDAPDPGPLPCLSQPPTFGMFQRPQKISDGILRAWRQIFLRLPEARLIVGSNSAVPGVRERLRAALGDRVEVRAASMHVEHLRAHQAIDLLLDTAPHTGGVTTLEGAWMGVPTVTLAGERLVERVSTSILTTLGCESFVAATPTQYVDLAVEWVTAGRDDLAAIRADLRARLAASPICTGYGAAVEAAYRTLWRTWCAKGD